METSERALHVIGPFGDESVRHLQDAATAVGVPIVTIADRDPAMRASGAAEPLAFLLRMNTPGAKQTCADVRSQPNLAHVPVFGVARDQDDLAFTELFTWGGDDLVSVSSPNGLERRLRALRSRPQRPAPAPSGPHVQVVVAGQDAPWRSVMGRALHNGGFGVRFATNAGEVEGEGRADGVRLVVAADDLEPDGAARALGRMRAGGSTCPWVLVAPPKRMATANLAVAPLGPASVMDGFAPPENVLFVANELLASRVADKRASPRLLFGTSVVFRPSGRSEDEVGFSYNISAGGAYVRTLAPPEAGTEIWLEMWSPRSERRVRLGGRVVWQRAFGPVGVATVPPGFGVRFTDGLAGDLERWTTGCSVLATGLLGAP